MVTHTLLVSYQHRRFSSAGVLHLEAHLKPKLDVSRPGAAFCAQGAAVVAAQNESRRSAIMGLKGSLAKVTGCMISGVHGGQGWRWALDACPQD